MVPTMKNCPGPCDLDAKVTTPELSEADGSAQETIVPVVPKGVVSVMSLTQITSGGVPSTVVEKK